MKPLVEETYIVSVYFLKLITTLQSSHIRLEKWKPMFEIIYLIKEYFKKMVTKP